MAYTITFDKNGGVGSIPSSITTDAATITLPTTHPSYKQGKEKYTITFDAGDGKISDTENTQTTKTSYEKLIFKKWNTRADGKGYDYEPGGAFSSGQSVTLYAIYATSSSDVTIVQVPTATKDNKTLQGWAPEIQKVWTYNNVSFESAVKIISMNDKEMSIQAKIKTYYSGNTTDHELGVIIDSKYVQLEPQGSAGNDGKDWCSTIVTIPKSNTCVVDFVIKYNDITKKTVSINENWHIFKEQFYPWENATYYAIWSLDGGFVYSVPIKVNGTFKNSTPQIKVNGVFKPISQIKIKTSNGWK